MNIPPMQPRADEYPSLQQARDADLRERERDVRLRVQLNMLRDEVADAKKRAMSDEDRTDKAATSHRDDGTGDTPVTEPMPEEKLAEVSATLTEAEHDALEFAVETGRVAIHDEATLRNLLERLNHDVAPEARAAEPESSVPLGSVAAPANTHTLTDEEREALETCIKDDEAATAYNRAATLRGLLKRLGGER